jgi:hypothetical protein
MSRAAASLPDRYDEIKTVAREQPHDAAGEAPPAGSTGFEESMATTDVDVRLGEGGPLPVTQPSVLGFEGVESTDLPALSVMDGILRTAQQSLDLMHHNQKSASLWRRLVLERRDSANSTIVTPLARNRFVVLVRSDESRILKRKSVVLGDVPCVRLSRHAAAASRDCFRLGDKTAADKLTDFFADEPFSGSAPLHALRLALTQTDQAAHCASV